MKSTVSCLLSGLLCIAGCSKSADPEGAPATTPEVTEKEAEAAPDPDEPWIETTARIIYGGTNPDGSHNYTLEYSPVVVPVADGDAPPPLQQHYLGKPRKPVEGQSLKLRFRRDEPVRFELLESIRFTADGA